MAQRVVTKITKTDIPREISSLSEFAPVYEPPAAPKKTAKVLSEELAEKIIDMAHKAYLDQHSTPSTLRRDDQYCYVGHVGKAFEDVIGKGFHFNYGSKPGTVDRARYDDTDLYAMCNPPENQPRLNEEFDCASVENVNDSYVRKFDTEVRKLNFVNFLETKAVKDTLVRSVARFIRRKDLHRKE